MTSVREVIANRNCIGCGGCAFAFPQSLSMRVNDEGHWQAQIIDGSSETDLRIAGEVLCPLSGATADETEIATALYSDLPVDERIGRYRRNVVGHVEAGEARALGSSGGLITWLLETLLSRAEVDAVIHVRPSGDAKDGLLFAYGVSRTVEEVRSGAKSRYYPIQMAEVLTMLAEQDGRYAVVGVPCFIKAVRLAERSGRIPPGRIRQTIGLVCGHLKSRHFAEYLAWQKGSTPGELETIDFRRKLPGRSAANYGFAFRDRRGEAEQVHPMSDVQGRDWGEGLLKNPACEYCDDVLAECADIAVGDAWLPGHVRDWRGTNVAVIRSAAMEDLIKEGERSGSLLLEEVSPDTIAQSQAAGLRHRREGLRHRLARRQEAGQWAPRKRVAARLEPSPARARIYDLRERIAVESGAAFTLARHEGDLGLFQRRMAPLLTEYQKLVQGGPVRRAVSLAKRVARRIAGR